MTKITRFDFSNESPHRWEDLLGQKASEGVTSLESRILWGAHEKLAGVRDFFRSPRLKLEKFLQLANAKGLKVELSIGFFADNETFPAWTWGTVEKTAIPASAWYPVPNSTFLSAIPSIHDPKLEEAFFGFSDELSSLLALYQHPGGPVTEVVLRKGIFDFEFPSTDLPAFQDAFASLYENPDTLNQRYGTSFKTVRAALTRPGFRTLYDKRPWVAAVEYRKARAKLWESFSSRWRKPIPSQTETTSSSPVHHPILVLIDGTLIEGGGKNGFVPLMPNGMLNPQAIIARRFADSIAMNALADNIPCLSTEDNTLANTKCEKVFVFSGKFLARATYDKLRQMAANGTHVYFPLGLPQFDEALTHLDWSQEKAAKQVIAGPTSLIVGDGLWASVKQWGEIR